MLLLIYSSLVTFVVLILCNIWVISKQLWSEYVIYGFYLLYISYLRASVVFLPTYHSRRVSLPHFNKFGYPPALNYCMLKPHHLAESKGRGRGCLWVLTLDIRNDTVCILYCRERF